MKATHEVLDLIYTPEEGQECFEGTLEECNKFVEEQGGATFTYKVVPKIIKKSKTYLAVLNISSWAGYCADAQHLYGHLYLSNHEEINVNTVTEWNVRHIGEEIELTREMTEQDAIKLDEIDGGKTHQRHFRLGDKQTKRFDTFAQVVKAGYDKWKELNLDCPFITLYEGDTYDIKNVKENNYEDAKTIILQSGETL